MKKSVLTLISIVTAVLASFLVVFALFAQDKFSLKAPNGISFAEIRGYEKWQTVATSFRTDNNEERVILANDTMIKAYQSGIPGNGKPFPEGSIVVKIGWSAVKNPAFEAALVPDALKRVEFIVKDSKRFPATDGWGYARFPYDAARKTFSVYGKSADFGDECFNCHAAVKDMGYIFTKYPPR